MKHTFQIKEAQWDKEKDAKERILHIFDVLNINVPNENVLSSKSRIIVSYYTAVKYSFLALYTDVVVASPFVEDDVVVLIEDCSKEWLN